MDMTVIFLIVIVFIWFDLNDDLPMIKLPAGFQKI